MAGFGSAGQVGDLTPTGRKVQHDAAGGLGVSPRYSLLPPRMGDQRGLISNVDTLAWTWFRSTRPTSLR